MPVRKNPMYGDPYLAQATQNIASMFAPADNVGQQALAFQKAAAEKLEAERLADLYANPNSPDFDRKAIAAGRQTGASSLYAVDQNNARELQQTRLQQAGALERNTADNSRAILTNREDNERALQTNQNTVRGTTIASLYGPLNEGQVRPAVPTEVMGAIGLPAVGQAEGREKKLTETQLKALILGQEAPEVQRNAALGGVGTQNVIGPDGRTIVQSNAGAIGMQPALSADKETEVSRLISERDRLQAGDPNRKAYDARIEALGRGQQQSAYDKETDEAFAKENQKIHSGASTARAQLSSLQFMRQLLANPETQQGFGGETALQAKKVLESLGIPVGDTSDAEVARALSNKLALYAKNEGGENLMPGAMSDSDRPFLQQQVAGLGNTRGANMKLLDYYERVQRRAIDVENLRQAYVQKNGRIDEGFRRELSAWAEANPVFPEARSRASAGAPAAGGSPAPATTPQFRVLSVR